MAVLQRTLDLYNKYTGRTILLRVIHVHYMWTARTLLQQQQQKAAGLVKNVYILMKHL